MRQEGASNGVEEKMEKRYHPRVSIENLSADAADGVGFFSGTVTDVSRFGVCLSDFPKKIKGEANKLTIIVSGHGKRFKMNVRPRWSSVYGVCKAIGAEILNPPWGWTEFIMQFEPKVADEVWATVNI